MSVVYKYPFVEGGNFVSEIEVPGHPLYVDFDPAGELCAWSLVEPDQKEPKFRVVVAGTGNPLPEGEWKHLNSFISKPFVFHAFVAAVAWVGESGPELVDFQGGEQS